MAGLLHYFSFQNLKATVGFSKIWSFQKVSFAAGGVVASASLSFELAGLEFHSLLKDVVIINCIT